MMNKLLVSITFLILLTNKVDAQCFASSGNPVGGTENMGVMGKNSFRTALFYRHAYSGTYFKGDQPYDGIEAILKDATYNYAGLLTAYGLSEKLTLEAEAGYFINKTQEYYIDDVRMTGSGLSNFVISIKPGIYFNPVRNFEISGSIGANIPLSTNMQAVNHVTLPIDIQPSTGSYGVVFQSQVIKEYSFSAIRILFANRIEKYFLNNHGWEFGTIYMHSLFFSKHVDLSKHFVIEDVALKHWTFILQLRNQVKERNVKDGVTVKASGNILFYLTPQINLMLHEKWNVSVLYDVPLYQYHNEVQLGHSRGFAVSLIRDFRL